MVQSAHSRLLASLLGICCCGITTPHVSAQDAVSVIEQLYRQASYEEALAALDRLPVTSAETDEYRIWCLLALGQANHAVTAMEELVRHYPHHRPDPSRFAPTYLAQFDTVRRRVLSQVVQTKYKKGREFLQAKAYSDAIVELEEVLKLLNDVEDNEEARQLGTFATSFLDLAMLASAVQPAAPKPVAATAASANDGRAVVEEDAATADIPERSRATTPLVFDTSSTDVTPPLPLKPILPPSSRDRLAVTPRSGLVEIVVDERGSVEAAAMRRSIDVEYDTLLLQQSRSWRFKPATRNGQPVKFRKLIEVYTAPLASLRR